MLACEKASVGWGYDRIFLKVKAGNLAAERLYKKLGYYVYREKNVNNEVMLCGQLNIPGTAEK